MNAKVISHVCPGVVTVAGTAGAEVTVHVPVNGPLPVLGTDLEFEESAGRNIHRPAAKSVTLPDLAQRVKVADGEVARLQKDLAEAQFDNERLQRELNVALTRVGDFEAATKANEELTAALTTARGRIAELEEKGKGKK